MWTEAPPVPVPVLHQVVGVGRLGVTVSDHHGDLRVNVAVPDQVGTLSTVGAVLAVERLAVRSAVITSVEGLGISQWTVAGSPPDPVWLRDLLAGALRYSTDHARRLRARLAVALRHSTDVVRRLGARDSSTARARVASLVDLLPQASETATVV